MDQTNSTRTFPPSLAIITAGVIIAGAIVFSSRPATERPAPQPQMAPSVDVAKVNVKNEPFIGDANAPVTIAYWYDYQCPFCQRNEQQVLPQLIKDYVDTGKVKIVFKDYQFLGPDSQTLGKLARAVWEVAPTKFYQWHKAIFENQGTENTGWATNATLLSVTASVLGSSDAQKAMQLAVEKNADAYQRQIDADKSEGSAMGISGTPASIIGTQLISGAQPYVSFQAAIEAVLKKP